MRPSLPLRLQELPPKWAHFCLGVERFLLKELQWGAKSTVVTVSCSGGLDSTALLLILHYLAPRLGCSLQGAHLDHGIRPDSAQDAEAAAVLCSELGIPFTLMCEDVPLLAQTMGVGLEEAGRMARLEMLARVTGVDGWSAVGHQLNDLAEDQLLRQLRGVGWPALGGMRGVVFERRIVRPLLLTPKEQLQGFLMEIGVGWQEDASNEDRSFLRNRVRHEILPLLLRENPAYLDSVAGLWLQARLDEVHWEHELGKAMSLPGVPEGDSLFLAAETLESCDRALRLRMYKTCLEWLGPGQPLTEGLLRLERAFTEQRRGAKLQFPGGKTALVTAQGVQFTSNA